MPHRDASTHLPRRSSRCNRPASRPGGSWRWLGTCTGRQALAACSVLLSSQPPWAFSIATTYNNHNNDKINNEDIIKEGRSRNHSLPCLVPLSTLLQLHSGFQMLVYVFVILMLLVLVLVLVQALELLRGSRIGTGAGTGCSWWWSW